mgnify:CR=1 FL=1
MGVLRFFTSVISVLDDTPALAFQSRLDEIAAGAKGFSYIGNRKTLSMLVRQEGETLFQRLGAIPEKQLEAFKDTDPTLIRMIRLICSKAAHRELDIVSEWLGSQWEKDSGVFPDFLLALDDKTTFGNGALLKDS